MADTTLRQQLAAATSVLALLPGAGSTHAQNAQDLWRALKPIPIVDPNPADSLNGVYRNARPAGVTEMPIEACAAQTRLNPQTKEREVVLGNDGKPVPVMPNRNSGMCFSPHVPDPSQTQALLQGPVRAFATAAVGTMNRSSLNQKADLPSWVFLGQTQAPAPDGQGMVDLGLTFAALGMDVNGKNATNVGGSRCVTTNGWVSVKNLSAAEGTPEAERLRIPVVSQFCARGNIPQ